jgi:Flp pilus assembly secretin CpaC
MAPIFLLGFGIFHSVFFAETGFAAGEAISLAIGEQRTFPVEPETRFSVGNSEVIQVKATQVESGGALLLIKGKSQGYSDLVLIGNEGIRRSMAFRVFAKKQAAIARDGEILLGKKSGLQIRPQGDGWLVRGGAESLEDWNLVKIMESQGKGKVSSLAKLHPLKRLEAQDRIRKLLAAAGLEGVEVSGIGNGLVLRGEVGSQAEKSEAEILAAEVVRGVRSQIRVPIERGGRLRFRARIMEILKSGALSLGMSWDPAVPSALQVTKHLTKANFSLEAALQIMERRGHARLLSRPELLLNEKGVAELKVGGEIPIPLRSRNSATVQWKPYGLLLRLELPGVARKTARANITVEISGLDPANSLEGIPAIRLSRMETQVDIEIGKPVMLSGLMENRESKSESMLPFLGDIPIIGELFRSRDFLENRSELAIILEARR